EAAAARPATVRTLAVLSISISLQIPMDRSAAARRVWRKYGRDGRPRRGERAGSPRKPAVFAESESPGAPPGRGAACAGGGPGGGRGRVLGRTRRAPGPGAWKAGGALPVAPASRRVPGRRGALDRGSAPARAGRGCRLPVPRPASPGQTEEEREMKHVLTV